MQTKTNDLTCISSKQQLQRGSRTPTLCKLQVLRPNANSNSRFSVFGLGTPNTLKNTENPESFSLRGLYLS